MALRPPPMGSALWAALLVALVLASSVVSLATAPEGRFVTTWWPAVGFSIALLALCPTRWWPLLLTAVAASTALTAWLNDSPWPYSGAFVLLSCLEAAAGAYVLRWGRAPEQVRLATQQDAVLMGLAALTAATVSAGGSALVGALDRTLPAGDLFRSVFPSHLASSLLVLLLVLGFRSPRRRVNRVEVAIQAAALAVTVAVIFSPGQRAELSTLPVPLLIWAGYRFGIRVVSWEVVATAVGVGLLTSAGFGPFTSVDGTALNPALVGTLTQGYLICVVLICVPVAIGVHTNDLLERELRAQHHLSDITLATTGCVILVTDIRGTVLRANAAVTSILGLEVDDVVGRPIWETIVPPERREVARAMFTAPDGSGVPPRVENGTVRDVEGREHRMLWTSGIVRDDDGTPTYVVMTGLDVTVERTASGLMEHLLAAAIDTAIIGTDPEGRITLVNTGARAMLGTGSREAVGTPFTDVFEPAALARWARAQGTAPTFDALVERLAGAPSSDWEWRAAPPTRRNGTGGEAGGTQTRRVSMALTRVEDQTKTLIGYLCIAVDLTEVHATADLLANALEKERQVVAHLKQLDTAKDQFVSTVSHELRTPVATIVGYGELLTDGDLGALSAPQVRALEAIVRNGERIVGLVDNLLALNDMAAPSPRWNRAPVDLVEVVRAAEAHTAELLQDRVLSTTFDVPDDPVLVLGDPAMLTQAVTNLLSNAVKFTEDGGQVRCLLDVLDDKARLLVDDTGLGIPEDEQEHVFERFWRSSTSQEQEIQGTGLGLPTVRSIVEAHGGSVELESNHLRGTTVTLLLPLAEEERSGAPAPDSEGVRPG